MKRLPAGVFEVWQGVVALVGLASLLLYTAFDLPLAFSNTTPPNPLAPLRAPLAADPVDREFRVLELTRGPAEPVELARLELAAGRGRQALELAENATEEAPRDAAAWVTLAEAELSLGDQEPWRLPRALEAAATALELAPAALDAREAQVRALAALGLSDLARRKAAPLRLEGVEVSTETESYLAELFEPSPPAARPGPVAGDDLPEAALGTSESAARRAYNAVGRQDTDCAPRLEQVERELTRLGSPMAIWATTKLAICFYFQQRFTEALNRLERVAQVGQQRGDRTLEGRAYWLRGLVEMVQGHFEASLASYEQSLELFRAAGETGHAAYVQLLAAKSLRLVGRDQEAWGARRGALAALLALAPERRFTVLDEVTDAALSEGFPRVSALLAAENERRSVNHGSTDEPIWAALDLAEARLLLGQKHNATAIATTALASAEALPENEVLRPWLQALAASSWAEANGDPEARRAAAVALLAVLEQRGEAGPVPEPRDVEHQLRAYSREAAALRDLGRPVDAEGAFRIALDRVEQLLIEVGPGDAEAKGLFLRGHARLFAELTRLQAVDLADPETALETVERARNRGLLEQVGALRGTEAGRVRSVAEVQAVLPPGVALVEYATLGAELGTWTVTPDEVSFERKSLGARALADFEQRLRRSNSSIALPEEFVAELGQALLPRRLRELPVSTRLLFVPSPGLFEMPFAALVAAARPGAPEPEVTPSASFYVGGAHTPRARFGEERVLLVINPAFSPREFPGLDPLLLADRQGRCLQARYPGATVVKGAAATPGAVLAALPTHDALYFVGHALSPSDRQGRAGLVLAPEPGGAFEEGFLPAEAIARLDLTSLRRVFLDACNTGQGTRARGQEMASLATAFLAAGAGFVKASLVPVLDSAVRVLDGRVEACGVGDGAEVAGEEKGFVWQTYTVLDEVGGRR